MKIIEDVDLSKISFMRIGGRGKFLVEIEKDSEIKDFHQFQKTQNFQCVFIGEGSNTIFSENNHEKIFVRFKQNDIVKLYENDSKINVKVSAGLIWDDFVKWSVNNNLSGIENLSGIPGTVGASPIQNIGAYGQEVKNVITNVEVYELETGQFYEIPNSECEFDYRDSVFKKNLGKMAIVNVSFSLNKTEPEFPTYKDLSLYFLQKQNRKPNQKEIREAILEIRSLKLPDWRKQPNCGSFFKNPIIDEKQAEKLAKKYPEIPQFNAGKNKVKISGGWLIERCGFKGQTLNKIKINDKNALVLINDNNASFDDLEKTIQTIQKRILKEFGINLEIEPNIIR